MTSTRITQDKLARAWIEPAGMALAPEVATDTYIHFGDDWKRARPDGRGGHMPLDDMPRMKAQEGILALIIKRATEMHQPLCPVEERAVLDTMWMNFRDSYDRLRNPFWNNEYIDVARALETI